MNRRFPDGGLAYGMPRNASTGDNFVVDDDDDVEEEEELDVDLSSFLLSSRTNVITIPCNVPYLVLTVLGLCIT